MVVSVGRKIDSIFESPPVAGVYCEDPAGDAATGCPLPVVGQQVDDVDRQLLDGIDTTGLYLLLNDRTMHIMQYIIQVDEYIHGLHILGLCDEPDMLIQDLIARFIGVKVRIHLDSPSIYNRIGYLQNLPAVAV